MDYVALKTEITTDPKALGYAPLVNISDNGIAGLLNSLTGLGAETVNCSRRPRGRFSGGLFRRLTNLPAG